MKEDKTMTIKAIKEKYKDFHKSKGDDKTIPREIENLDLCDFC